MSRRGGIFKHLRRIILQKVEDNLNLNSQQKHTLVDIFANHIWNITPKSIDFLPMAIVATGMCRSYNIRRSQVSRWRVSHFNQLGIRGIPKGVDA